MTLFLCSLALWTSIQGAPLPADATPSTHPLRSVILFVWDGLRPDSINPQDTPNLATLAQNGSRFSDHHATYPTFTMLNAATFATGNAAGATGFFGNSLWQPTARGNDAFARPVDFSQPVFTEDHAILRDLRDAWDGALLLVPHLFNVAQTAHLATAAVGKSGPAFLQDYRQGGNILDERMATPLSFVQALQAAGFAVPKETQYAFAPGVVVPFDADPTTMTPPYKLADGITNDPTDTHGGPATAANRYLMDTYLRYLVTRTQPQLSVVWLRHPDTAQHLYGVNTANAREAVRAQDALLGQLLEAIRASAAVSPDREPNLLIASDHGHSTIAGPPALMPLRRVADGAMGEADNTHGYAASGAVRLADLLNRRGISAFDGAGCLFDPVLSGWRADGTPVYPTQFDSDGSVCGRPGTRYTTRSYLVPKTLPKDAVVVAMNGGSEYLYVPSHDPVLIRQLVRILASREEIGAMFVDSRYGEIPGTLSLALIDTENRAGRSPDLIVSYAYDETVRVAQMPGIEFASMQGFGGRGMHGSFSPIDVHNTLIAYGPDFRRNFVDALPTGNVDVAPTIAHLLGLALPTASGRVLVEALREGDATGADVSVQRDVVRSAAAVDLRMELPTDPNGGAVDDAHHTFVTELHRATLRTAGTRHTYFDFARGIRQ